jgi:transcriptional regulator with XRE-family HTH domain
MFSQMERCAIIEGHQLKSGRSPGMIRARLMKWFVAILLRDARIAAKLTQAEAAQEFGCHPQNLYYWEKGERHPRPSEVSQIAETYHLSDELKMYLKMILENRDSTLLQADARLHALALAKAELHSGIIFKYESHLIPGPLQTRDYHFLYTQKGEGTSDQAAGEGWTFKYGRQVGIRKRKKKPKIQYLIGDSAIYGLRDLPRKVALEQVQKMLKEDELSNVEIRVIKSFHPGRSTPFSVYKPGTSDTAPPIFVFSEILHGSWCIEDDALVPMYDDAGQAMWQLGIPLKEFLYEYCRDLLAEEHS